jgi:hypothetical protein
MEEMTGEGRSASDGNPCCCFSMRIMVSPTLALPLLRKKALSSPVGRVGIFNTRIYDASTIRVKEPSLASTTLNDASKVFCTLNSKSVVVSTIYMLKMD